MMEQNRYEQELKNICEKMKKSFSIKLGLISGLLTKRCLNKILKLNNKTNNTNLNELIYVIGRTNLEYKKYCNDNNYYTDPYVNKKIKQAYTKLSKKAIKIASKKSNIKNNMSEIEYNSDRGSYIFKYIQGNNIVKTKEYKINNIKNLDVKRKNVIIRLKQINYGINFFDELGVDEKRFNKINPDIINILLNEGKVMEAKMYIKEVMSGEKLNKPLKIKYVLNRNVKKGVFSPEENKNMKKMAKADRLANSLTIFSEKKVKEIKKTKESIFKKAVISVFNIHKAPVPVYENKVVESNKNEFERRIRITSNNLKNSHTGKIAAYSNTQDFRRENIMRYDFIKAQKENKLKNNKKLINTCTGKVVAYGSTNNEKKELKNLVCKKTGRIVAKSSAPDVNRKQIKMFINTNTGKIAAYGER